MNTREKINRKRVGDYCENIAVMFLVKHGFSIVYKNYRKSFGEIDIIAEKDQIIHFVEVKSVSHETLRKGIKPEDHVTREKIRRIARTAEFFLTEHDLFNTSCQIDLVTVIGGKLSSVCYFEKVF